jgi:hypothetical protein
MSRATYSTDDLAEAAAASWCMTDMLQRLGVPPTPGRRSYLRSRLKRLGIPLEHWQHSPRTPYPSQALEEAVRTSTSYAGVLRTLGIPVAGGSQACLARRIRREGIDTTHFLGQAHLRGKAGRRKPPGEILVVLPKGAARVKTPLLRRAMHEAGVPHVCAECGAPPFWRGRPLTLVVDHVDGNWLDNRLANLRYLCPNCHAQTATWCRRKRGP